MKNFIKITALSIAIILLTGCQKTESRNLSTNQTDKMILVPSLITRPIGTDDVIIYKKVCLDGKHYYASRSHTGYWIIGSPVMNSVAMSAEYVESC